MINESKGIFLDIGCGENKKAGYLGMDKRALDGVDIVHDLEKFPYPIPDNSCEELRAFHVVEHIKPWLMIDFMNELWRIMKKKGHLTIDTPYAGSFPYWMDPTHCNGCNEATWQYFDPRYPMWGVYRPEPWYIISCSFNPVMNMQVVLMKVKEKKIPEEEKIKE